MSALPMQIVINHLVVFSINLGELIQVVSRIKMMGGFPYSVLLEQADVSLMRYT